MLVRGDRAARGIVFEFESHERLMLQGLLDHTADALEDPTHPFAARLLPPGYRDDPEAAAEFAKYTQDDLRRGKLDRIAEFRALLDDPRRRLVVDRRTGARIAQALTDVRLVVAELAGVTDEHPEPADPGLAGPYEWLGGLQWGIVDNLDRLDVLEPEGPGAAGR